MKRIHKKAWSYKVLITSKMIALTVVLLCSGFLSKAPNHNITKVDKQPNASSFNIVIDNNQGSPIDDKVNPNLFGFNIEYTQTSDFLWANGSSTLATKLKDLNIGLLRYPGGTLVTFYHWKRGMAGMGESNVGVQGHSDAWDKAYNPAKDTPGSEFMNLDEYLLTKNALGTEPLIGINMSSGKRFPERRAECLQEAVSLVKYVKSKTPKGSLKYYYLDNEPYMGDANHTYTPAEYAAEINYYVPALKAVDPNIKIIINSKNEPTNPVWTPTIIKDAGANIDFIDIHFYWKWSGLDFQTWKDQPIMTNQGRPFDQERAALKAMAHKAGFDHIDLVTFEWNSGKNIKAGSSAPTEAEHALMTAEQLMLFMKSGVPMACFWPIHWKGDPKWNRALFHSEGGNKYSTNKVYDMFKLFNTTSNTIKIPVTINAVGSGDPDRIRCVAVKDSGNGNKLQVFLINKNQNEANLDLHLPNFQFKDQSAIGFESTDTGHGNLNVHQITLASLGNRHLKLTLPANSLVKINVSR